MGIRFLAIMGCATLFAIAQQPLTIEGIVRDQRGGEALAQVKLTSGGVEVRTGKDGRFRLTIPAPGELRVSSVGYRTLRLDLKESTPQLEIVLTPDTLSQRDSIEVREGPFQPQVESSPSERTLNAAELKNLSGVLANDPLRAVQSLPGVASSNDYTASFSVRGADFQRLGIFLDGVLLNNPLHSTQGQQSSGSLSMVNTDVVEEITLHAGAPPVRYMDRSAADLEMRVREGSTTAPSFRLNAGVAASTVLAEGPIPRGSYLISVRKSYLQYLLQKAATFDTLAFGFFDVQGKLAYNLTNRHHVWASLFDGLSELDRTKASATLGINSILDATYHFTNIHLGHRWTGSDRFLWTNRLAWMRERSDNRNVRQLPLNATGYGEWVANTDAEWYWTKQSPLRLGASFRRQHDDGFNARYLFNPLSLRRLDPWGATALRSGGYAEQSWSRGVVSATAGLRFDDSTSRQPAAISPHASARFRVGPATQIVTAFSQAIQYTPLSQITIANIGNPNLLPNRSIHAVAGIDQALSMTTHVRLEAYYRADRDLVAQPLIEARLLADGRIFAPPSAPRYENSVRGSAKGFEIFLQRRSANRWSGWVSYGYSKTAVRDGITGAHYPSDFDQRHTINAFLNYRLSPTINLSLRHSYGSNFPIPGFFTLRNGQYYLSQQRNQLRLPSFQRTDFRLNKQIERKRWRGVLFVEVMNLFNNKNQTFDTYNGYDAATGQARVSLLQLFPIVPAAGWMMDWGGRTR